MVGYVVVALCGNGFRYRLVWIEEETISSFWRIFDLIRRSFDACYLFLATVVIGLLIHTSAFIHSHYHHLFQLFSILSVQLLLYLHLQPLYNHSHVPHSPLIPASLSFFCISLFIRYLFRYFIYSVLTAEYASLLEDYFLYWRKKICYRHKLGWNSEDSVDNSCLCFSSSCHELCGNDDLSLWNVAEYFWDYSLLLILNSLTGISFLVVTLLLFALSLLYSLALHVVLLLISGMFLLYLLIFPLDLFGALLNHHLSSSDLFTFHILRGMVFLLEHFFEWVYAIRYPLTSWREYKPNYSPLHIAIVFLFSHLFTGSRAFILLDELSYHPDPSAAHTYQKYLTDADPESNISTKEEDEDDPPFQLFLSPVCLLMMISESILCFTSAILVAIAYIPSWTSFLLILLSIPSLVADLVMMISLHRKRSQSKRILVLDNAEPHLEALSGIPHQDLIETRGVGRDADYEKRSTENKDTG